MKNKLSELMDGELANQDAKKIIETLNKENELKNDWETYHLIGDILRQQTPSSLSTMTQRVKQQLKLEPIIFKPHKTAFGLSKIKVFSFATAASIVAMITVWVVMQDVSQQSPAVMVAEQPNTNIETGNAAKKPVLVSHSQPAHSYPPYGETEDMNNYLFFHNFHNFHKDFSAGAPAHGQSVYIYPVKDSHDKYGR